MGRRAVLVASLLLTVAASGLAVTAWGWGQYTRPGPLAAPRIVLIPKGQGLEAIAGRLRAAGVVRNAWIFEAGTRIAGFSRQLQAGEYRFPERVSARGAAAILRSGRTVIRRLTVVEGLTARAVLARVAVHDGLSGDAPAVPEEGSLLPETYHFSYGDDRAAMIARMQRDMTAALAGLWRTRQPDLPYRTPRDALVMASIVQREAGAEAEMALIAGVFVNRLRRGMRLQSDPTVAYGIAPEGLGRPLRLADLGDPNPYNTYRIRGLPPGPICNPGRAALHAALNPAETDFLYFVVDGTGRHAFSATLEGHNHNVARWRRIQRDAARAAKH